VRSKRSGSSVKRATLRDEEGCSAVPDNPSVRGYPAPSERELPRLPRRSMLLKMWFKQPEA
jgi:hypothetical protein